MDPARSTRGKTRPGRLSRLDALLPQLVPELATGDGAVVDLGLGAVPWTTQELRSALAAWNPDLLLVGAEVDTDRLAAAARADPSLLLVGAGFDLPLRPRLIRAVNLLRQYPLDQVADAHARLGRALAPGGAALVGATDRTGDRFGVHVLRRRATGLVREALVLGTTWDRGFAPLALRDHLPRDLRHRVRPGEAIYAFFCDWTAAWHDTRTAWPQESFSRSVAALARARPGVRLAAPGVLIWQPAAGIPE